MHLNEATDTVNITQLDGTLVYQDKSALHYPKQVEERTGPLGEMSTKIIDVFIFEEDKGNPPPDVKESYVISIGSNKYYVTSSRLIPFRRKRLIVETERNR